MSMQKFCQGLTDITRLSASMQLFGACPHGACRPWPLTHAMAAPSCMLTQLFIVAEGDGSTAPYDARQFSADSEGMQGMALILPEESAPQDGRKILPRAVWTLKALRALNLSQNAFKSCPAGLSQLTNLQFLDVSGCKEMQVRTPTVLPCTWACYMAHDDGPCQPAWCLLMRGLHRPSKLLSPGSLRGASDAPSSRLAVGTKFVVEGGGGDWLVLGLLKCTLASLPPCLLAWPTSMAAAVWPGRAQRLRWLAACRSQRRSACCSACRCWSWWTCEESTRLQRATRPTGTRPSARRCPTWPP